MEWFIAFLFSLPLGLYLILYFIAAEYLKRDIVDVSESKFCVAVLIPFKNELNSLPNLINSLINIELNAHSCIYLIDDYSTDGSYEYLKENLFVPQVILIKNSGVSGKKNAIADSIHRVEAEIILTADADCEFNKNWVKLMTYPFIDSKIQMNCGLVLPSNASEAYPFGMIEFISLIASTHAFGLMHFPFMCNGANLAYRKSAFMEVAGFDGNEGIASGDDVFLLHKFKMKYGRKSICFTAQEGSEVSTELPTTGKKFFKQRHRWGGKAIHYKDAMAVFMALLISVLSVLQVASIFLLMTDWFYWTLMIWIVKLSMDTYFLRKAFILYRLPIRSAQLVLAGLRYPFYILSTVLLIFIKKENSWK